MKEFWVQVNLVKRNKANSWLFTIAPPLGAVPQIWVYGWWGLLISRVLDLRYRLQYENLRGKNIVTETIGDQAASLLLGPLNINEVKQIYMYISMCPTSNPDQAKVPFKHSRSRVLFHDTWASSFQNCVHSSNLLGAYNREKLYGWIVSCCPVPFCGRQVFNRCTLESE